MRSTYNEEPDSNVFLLFLRYSKYSMALTVLTLLSNGLGLAIPKLIAGSIDSFSARHRLPQPLFIGFMATVMGIFIFAALQEYLQTVAAETIARDLRRRLIAKISRQHNATIEKETPAFLLTVLIADVNNVKQFVGLAVSILIANIFMVIGSGVLLIMTNWKLGLIVLTIIPIVGLTFGTVMGKVRRLFKRGQEMIDRLNQVIGESIFGAGLVRILHSQSSEEAKFNEVNEDSRQIGLGILGYFSGLIPIITLTGSLAVLAILVLGGRYVITGSMSLGNFVAFNNYIGLLIFPIITVGFMSNIIVRATASYGRILRIFSLKDPAGEGTLQASGIRGDIEFRNVSLRYGEKTVLKDISFTAKAGTRTAIIGPTAAGKSQIVSLITGLAEPTTGTIAIDGKQMDEYIKPSLNQQLGAVFQQSIVFRTSLRENIAFSTGTTEKELTKAIETARLVNFVGGLPKGLETAVTERGSNLSGGQRQRLMLARALALDPKILVLDDFTARVDMKTEAQIQQNVQENYPGVTLISVTQKINSVKDYDQILVLMEGELIACGTHEELLKSSPEYMQMYESQKSTHQYEVSTR